MAKKKEARRPVDAEPGVYAVVDDAGRIENMILAHPDFELEGKGLVLDTKRQGRIGGTHDGRAFADPPSRPPEPLAAPSPAVLQKVDLWERATDEEALAIMSALDAAPPRLRMIWQDSLTIDHAGPRFQEIRDLIGKAVKTKKRADELLAPRAE